MDGWPAHAYGTPNTTSFTLAHHQPLIPFQPPNNTLHLSIRINPEPFVPRHTRQLHVLAIQLLLHYLLQRLQHHHLRLLQRERFVEFVLEFRLCAFGAGADGFRVVAVVGARGFGVVATPTALVVHASKYGGHIAYRLGPSSSNPAINSATPKGLLIILSSPSAPSPNLKAKSQIACVQLSTPNRSLKWNS